MTDDKAAAAYHPFKSAEEMHRALKPRDEIAQVQVEGREAIAGVDLSVLPVKELHQLAQGDIVLHEGFWVQIDEYEVNDQGGWIRLKFILPNDERGSTWARRIIASREEKFYVPEKVASARAAGAKRRAARNPDLVHRVPPRDQQV